jgi:hypothetical protein
MMTVDCPRYVGRVIPAGDLVDGQLDHVGLSVSICCSGVRGADREVGEGGQGEGCEPVPGNPAADLVLVETDLALAGLERLLHDPTDSRYPHELGEDGRAGGPAAVGSEFTGGVVAADQQTVPTVVVGITISADVVVTGQGLRCGTRPPQGLTLCPQRTDDHAVAVLVPTGSEVTSRTAVAVLEDGELLTRRRHVRPGWSRNGG